MFNELRKIFFDFFESKGHISVESSSIIPDDSSVLFTTAGMQQFKRYYTNEIDAKDIFKSRRVTSIQKCLRTNDIEEVGDLTHLTFFEMMGNFSFGPIGEDVPYNVNGDYGYFKKSAITWAWQFLTEILKIDTNRIFVTVFAGDKNTPEDIESYEIWEREIGLDKSKIHRGNRKNNFWGPTGNSGPCGPATEIYIDGIEVWNIVFNEYYANNDGDEGLIYKKVDMPGIDTGMGFERLLSVLEKKDNVFETSAFSEIVSFIKKTKPGIDDKLVRILSDHIRASVFIIADGIEPSNKDAGYVLRRLLRRIIGININENIDNNLFVDVYEIIKNQYSNIYSNINNESMIVKVWNDELSKFEKTITKGIAELEKMFKKTDSKIGGDILFEFYTTFGVPPEITIETAERHKFKISKNAMKEFDESIKKHQEISRAGVGQKFGGHGLVLDTGELKAENDEEMKRVIRMHTATHLLQWALRKVLGDGIHQMGSDINAKRLRFDFPFDRRLSEDELKTVENLINEKIDEDIPVGYKEMSKDDALSYGALAFFKQKYPEKVKVYYIGDDKSDDIISKEFCAGPHVTSTKEIGKFNILKQESIGKGVKRIKATVE